MTLAGLPQQGHTSEICSCSKGMQRLERPAFFLFIPYPRRPRCRTAHRLDITAFSLAAISITSSMVEAAKVRAARFAWARVVAGLPTAFNCWGIGLQLLQRGKAAFHGPWRTSTHCPFSMSLGPISSRRGTPFISHWANFHPGNCRRRQLHAAEPCRKARAQLLCFFHHAGLVRGHRARSPPDGRHSRGQDKALVIAVRHDDGTHQDGWKRPTTSGRDIAVCCRVR